MSNQSKAISRRKFLSQSVLTAAGLVAAGGIASCSRPEAMPAVKGRVIGANDRINIAVIGLGGRGAGIVDTFGAMKGVRIKTICDIDENIFAGYVKRVVDAQGDVPMTSYDLRRVYDDKDIDAVTISTPNHWHALATIWACQAGKHVYVEKPCCHNVYEGRKMVEAARRYNRIVQVGFQNRSIIGVRQAMKFLHDGKLGKIYMAKGLCYKPRDGIGRYPDSPVPKGVHYDIWLGPAPLRPFNQNRFKYNWHWHWDYGNGDIGNQGVHQLDVAMWGMNKNEHPVKISSSGGYYAFDSCQETPNTQTAVYEYSDGSIMQFEVRGLYTNDENGITVGNLFYGTEGWMYVNGGQWKTYLGRKNEPGPYSENAGPDADPTNLAGAGGGGHSDNFIYAVRSGKMTDLTCDIEVGNMSSALPHLANIAYRLGRTLTFDGKKEQFTGDRQASRMLTREYRKPYVVPESV